MCRSAVVLDSLEDFFFNSYFLKLDFNTCCGDQGSVGLFHLVWFLVFYFVLFDTDAPWCSLRFLVMWFGVKNPFGETLIPIVEIVPLFSSSSGFPLHACYTPVVP